MLSMFHCTPKHETTSHIQYTVVPDETKNNTLAINSTARSILMTSLVVIFFSSIHLLSSMRIAQAFYTAVWVKIMFSVY